MLIANMMGALLDLVQWGLVEVLHLPVLRLGVLGGPRGAVVPVLRLLVEG